MPECLREINVRLQEASETFRNPLESSLYINNQRGYFEKKEGSGLHFLYRSLTEKVFKRSGH